MKAQALLSELRSRGVELAAEGLQLTVDAPAGAITEDLRAALVDNKPRLIRLLTGERLWQRLRFHERMLANHSRTFQEILDRHQAGRERCEAMLGIGGEHG